MEVPILLAILAVALVLFVTQLVRIEVTALGIIVALAFFGILTPEEALSGFSSPATLTVAAMLVLSVGLERTGVVEFGARLLSGGKGALLPSGSALGRWCSSGSAFRGPGC